MNKKYFLLISLILPFLAGCRSDNQIAPIVSMQMVDRNGFSETISNHDRLKIYDNVDFLTSQPYEKVLRVYKKDEEGKSHSKLTCYHPNGGIWKYLEAVDGRAHGKYLEWHENGKIKIEAIVIEGLADLNENSQRNWLFDSQCTVWNEHGDLEASFTYEKGYLVEDANYYYPSGKIEKTISYKKGQADGLFHRFDEEENLLEEIQYKDGVKEGSAMAYWNPATSRYQEQYREGYLINAIYFDVEGNVISEIENGRGVKAEFKNRHLHQTIIYQNGKPDGEIKVFTSNGALSGSYSILEGKKTGSEWEYYPSMGKELRPKLMITWSEDQIQGMVKTWYENGTLESQKEMTGNKKHGLSFAYYQTGDLMLMEEYENNHLVKGSYYKKGENTPISIIEKGEGIATLYNAQGHFLKKITYERGKPLVE